MFNRPRQLMVGICCALIFAALPVVAFAQSCNTQVTGGVYATMTTTSCSDGSSSATVCTGSSPCQTWVTPAPRPAYVPPPPPVYVAPPPLAPPAPPVDLGVTINMNDGTQKYLARGTFVKPDAGPPMYSVYGGQLHAYSTWPQFLNAGGNPDLSNVVLIAIVDNGTLYGSPVR
jgi:hypothetical protein